MVSEREAREFNQITLSCCTLKIHAYLSFVAQENYSNTNTQMLRKTYTGTNIVDSVVDMAMAKQRQALYRTARKVTKSKRNLLDVPKLEDAIKAAGPRSHECT